MSKRPNRSYASKVSKNEAPSAVKYPARKIVDKRATRSMKFDYYKLFIDYPLKYKLTIGDHDFGEISIDYHPNKKLSPGVYDKYEEIHPLILAKASNFTNEIERALNIHRRSHRLSAFFSKPCIRSIFLPDRRIRPFLFENEIFEILRDLGPMALGDDSILNAVLEWYAFPESLASKLTKLADALLAHQVSRGYKRKKGPPPVELVKLFRRDRLMIIYRLFTQVAREARKALRVSERAARKAKKVKCDAKRVAREAIESEAKDIYGATIDALLKRVAYSPVDYEDGVYFRFEDPSPIYHDTGNFISDFVEELIIATRSPFKYFAERDFKLKSLLEGSDWSPNEIGKLITADLFNIKVSSLDNFLYRHS